MVQRQRKYKGKHGRGHDWGKGQPHQAVTGKITTRKYAEQNPGKVEWVTNKKRK